MKEILDFAFSGFWRFLGCWFIFLVICQFILIAIKLFFKGITLIMLGYPPSYHDEDNKDLKK